MQIQIQTPQGTFRFRIPRSVLEQEIQSLMDTYLQGDFGGKRGLYNSIIGSVLMSMGEMRPKNFEGDNLTYTTVILSQMILERTEHETLHLKGDVHEDHV